MFSNFSVTDIYTSQYSQSNIVFLNHQSSIAYALANRVRLVDLNKKQSYLLPFQLKHNITIISHNDQILIAVDKQGRSIIISLKYNTLIGHFNFKKPVTRIIFSNKANLFVAVIENGLKVYSIPSLKRNFQPIYLIRKIVNLHSSKIISCSFTPDDRFIITWAKDLLVKIVSVFYIPQYIPFQFATHRQKIVLSFTSPQNDRMYTLDKAGVLYQWRWVQDFLTEQYLHKRNIQRGKRQYLSPSQLQACLGQYASFSEKRINHGKFIMQNRYNFGISGTRINSAKSVWPFLFLCFKNGCLSVLRYPFNQQNPIQIVHFDHSIKKLQSNKQGKWLSFSSNNKILVYEWKSRAIIHSNKLYKKKSIAINDRYLIAGGQGLCLYNFSTGFNQHSFDTEQIISVSIQKQLAAALTIFSEIIAIDLRKNLIFRRMKTTVANKLTAVQLDPSSQIVVATGFDPYDIYIWNIQTGNLILNISDHQAPVVDLAFSSSLQHSILLVSASWDKTVRIHKMFSKQLQTQILQHNSQVIAVTAHPTKAEIASSTMNGQLCIWDINISQIKAVIPVALDMQPGRSQVGLMSVKKDNSGKFIRCICYSSCGRYLLGGGKGKNLLIYSTQTKILLKRISLTQSFDLDNVRSKLNSRFIKQGINIANLSDQSQLSDYQDRKESNRLPGVVRQDVGKRIKKQPMQCFNIRLNTNDTIIISTSYGLLKLSQFLKKVYNPSNLQGRPQDIPKYLKNKQYLLAILTSLQLGLNLNKVLLYVPISMSDWIISNLSDENIIEIIIKLSQEEIGELHLSWLKKLLKKKGYYIKQNLYKYNIIENAMVQLEGKIDALQIIGSLKNSIQNQC